MASKRSVLRTLASRRLERRPRRAERRSRQRGARTASAPQASGGRGLSSRAQSESIGVILLTAVIVLLIGGFGLVYLGATGDAGESPLVDAEVTATADTLSITHGGGEAVPYDELDVIVRGEDSEQRFPLDAANATDDGNGDFDPSERFGRAHAVGGGQLEVLLVHTASNAVIHHAYLDTGGGDGSGATASASFSHSPTDPEPGDAITFDASPSSGAGGVATYAWDWDDDGTYENSTASPTIEHTFAAGDHDVTLLVTDSEGTTASTTGTIAVDYLRANEDPIDAVDGITYQYYDADDEYASMPDFGAETPTRTGVTDQPDLDPAHREDEFAFRYTGYVEVPEDGEYTFRTTSDDGSQLSIGDTVVVDNGGLHANATESGTIGLEAGNHSITVTMFEHTGSAGLDVAWSGPGVTDGTIPASAFHRREAPVAAMTRSCGGRECTFDASGSTNPGGSIAGYEWSFGDGETATGATVTHTYDSLAEYTATLSVTGDGGATDSTSSTFTLTSLLPALSPEPVVQGVDYRYYEASDEYTALADVDWSAPTRTGTTDGIDLDPIDTSSDEVALRFQTYLDVPENDSYTFYTSSDDGSRLYVDGRLVVDNAGLHAEQEESGEVALEEGYHNVTVQWFEHEGQVALSASYASTNVSKQPLPASRLYRSEGRVRWETAADWDGATSEAGVVHAAFGDRSADAVALGYPNGSEWGPSPVAYWPLDEDGGSATAADVIGGNDGTVEGATTGAGGTLGTTGYAFDGTDDYVDGATDLAALRGTASVGFWINTTQSGDDTMYQAPGVTGVESGGDGDDVFWGWLDADGHVGVQAGDADGASSTTAVDDGTWHHVVLTRDAPSGEVAVYVDGTLEDTATSRTGTVSTTFSSIGRIEDTGGTPAYFDGRLEDLQVYDSVLSGAEAATLADVTDGTLTTDGKAFASPVDPSGLTLRNVSATLPAGTSANVTVHSDPDGDGTYEETADVVALSEGTTSYSVTGLSSASADYRLEIGLSTTDPRRTPRVDRLELGA